ncbi:hypothetical protein AGMMS50255_2550 [Spirochaetia bacterium]|nr:hypothetical protein AGMMS50255_2550 [Spirochaetia bacterium]
MNVNREVKNSVFSLLFNDSAVLRELYQAIEEVSLPPNTPITINTLSNVLFMRQLNDLSFMVDKKLVVLVEHQSTINPNMPLRLLMYIARVYEKIFDKKKLYAKTALNVPWPEFIVLYNGVEPYPDQKTLKLSDMFEKVDHLKGGQEISHELELVLRVYNINKGHNEAILQKCKELNDYSTFIAKAREYHREPGDEEKATIRAIKYCTENNILKTFHAY